MLRDRHARCVEKSLTLVVVDSTVLYDANAAASFRIKHLAQTFHVTHCSCTRDMTHTLTAPEPPRQTTRSTHRYHRYAAQACSATPHTPKTRTHLSALTSAGRQSLLQGKGATDQPRRTKSAGKQNQAVECGACEREGGGVMFLRFGSKAGGNGRRNMLI